MRALTFKEAHEVASILRDHAGFRGDTDTFVSMQTQRVCTEYRFQGSLGFGGKLWRDRDRMRVSCYAEDETPERLAVIEKVNGLIAGIARQVTA